MPLAVAALAALGLAFAGLASAQDQDPQKRPMTFLDMQLLKQAGSPAPSPDGNWLLYTVSTPDWTEAKRQTDIFLVSLKQGLPSTKQMTYTKEKDEASPRWSRDGAFFVFASNRDAPSGSASQRQLYLMRPDGGEARRITDAKDGVSTFAFSRDGRWLAYRAGKSGEEQLYRLPVDGIDTAKPGQLTKQEAGVGEWF
ncbi:MAG: TolB family protein, partial [Rhodospirillaceae bacterium]